MKNDYIKTEEGKKIAEEKFNEMKEIINNEKMLYNIVNNVLNNNMAVTHG